MLSLNTLPGVGGTAIGVELAGLELNVNTEAGFPGSCFVALLVSGPVPPNEKMDFILDVLAVENGDGLTVPLWACVPPPVTGNSTVDVPVPAAVGFD